jgi:Phage integrase family
MGPTSTSAPVAFASRGRPRRQTPASAAFRSFRALEERLGDQARRYPDAPGQPAFPTRDGTRQHPDNIRSRILAPIRARANEVLEADGRLPIGQMTPHSLRRTFASILAVCDVPPRRAMYLMGHTDPSLTLAVYQQVLDMGKGSIELLEQILGCRLAEARAIYNGELAPADRVRADRKRGDIESRPERSPKAPARRQSMRTRSAAGSGNEVAGRDRSRRSLNHLCMKGPKMAASPGSMSPEQRKNPA